MSVDTEKSLRFGPEQRLIGILNHRDGDVRVACVLMNVGVTHHIGPRRLNVKLARALAQRALPSLRFDLSGIGDSGAGGAGGTGDDYRSQSVADLRAAMDKVEAETGIRHFAVLGICSGAVNGYRVALEDDRVVGVLMFEGYAFPTWRTHVVHDWRRLVTTMPSQWAEKVVRRLRRMLGISATERRVSIFYATRDSSTPDRREFGAALDRLADRGVAIFIGYSGSLLAVHNHESQFQHAFPGHRFWKNLTYRYLPHIDHIPTSQAAQAEFVTIASDWAAKLGTRYAR